MTFKNLLVHVDNTEACAARIAAALTLAETHDAHLTGLALAAEFSMPTYIGSQMPVAVLEMQSEQAIKLAQEAAQKFDKALAKSGRKGESRIISCLDIDAASTIALHGRHADLVVLGQVDSDKASARDRHLVEEVTLSVGRPTLVVPYIGTAGSLGRRVLVAWDVGRESTRAINDALPILKLAESVTILSINPRPGYDAHGEEPGADIGLHLARHDVRVEVQRTQVKDIDTGEALLSRLADAGSDLLVMGAYGHSRMREFVLGGVTRTLLAEMTVPVLMSH